MYAKSFILKSKNPSLAEIEALVKEKHGSKYKTEIKAGKSGIVAFAMNKSKEDTLYIKKNGYHAIAIQSSENDGYPVITAWDLIPNSAIEMAHKQTGVLLRFIFPLIWGKGKDLCDDVDTILGKHFDVESISDANDYNVMNMAKNAVKGVFNNKKDELLEE